MTPYELILPQFKRFSSDYKAHQRQAEDAMRREVPFAERAPRWMEYVIPPLADAICDSTGWTGYHFGGPVGGLFSLNFVKDGQRTLWMTFDVRLDLERLFVTDWREPNEPGERRPPFTMIEPHTTLEEIAAHGMPIQGEAWDDRTPLWPRKAA